MTVEILHSGFDGLRLTIETDVTPALRLWAGSGRSLPFKLRSVMLTEAPWGYANSKTLLLKL